MANLVTLAVPLILNQLLGDDGTPLTKGNKIGQGLMALSGFFAFVASGFFVTAAYLWLMDNYQPDVAAALTGLTAFTLAALFCLSAFGIHHYKQQRIKKVGREISGLLHDALDFIDEELSEPIQDNPKTSALVASVAGFTVGKKAL